MVDRRTPCVGVRRQVTLIVPEGMDETRRAWAPGHSVVRPEVGRPGHSVGFGETDTPSVSGVWNSMCWISIRSDDEVFRSLFGTLRLGPKSVPILRRRFIPGLRTSCFST